MNILYEYIVRLYCVIIAAIIMYGGTAGCISDSAMACSLGAAREKNEVSDLRRCNQADCSAFVYHLYTIEVNLASRLPDYPHPHCGSECVRKHI